MVSFENKNSPQCVAWSSKRTLAAAIIGIPSIHYLRPYRWFSVSGPVRPLTIMFRLVSHVYSWKNTLLDRASDPGLCQTCQPRCLHNLHRCLPVSLPCLVPSDTLTLFSLILPLNQSFPPLSFFLSFSVNCIDLLHSMNALAQIRLDAVWNKRRKNQIHPILNCFSPHTYPHPHSSEVPNYRAHRGPACSTSSAQPVHLKVLNIHSFRGEEWGGSICRNLLVHSLQHTDSTQRLTSPRHAYSCTAQALSLSSDSFYSEHHSEMRGVMQTTATN